MTDVDQIRDLHALLDRFGGAGIAVVGDIMLDEYWWGTVDRISPEAPVPVVTVERQESKLGGAANVARNLRALGGAVTTVGVIGDDRSGEIVCERLRDEGLSDGGIVIDPARPTTRKTRVVAHSQQVVRADHESNDNVGDMVTEQLINACAHALDHAAGIVISDYGKGVVTEALVDAVVKRARGLGKFIAVDPKDAHVSVYRRVTTMTPNHHEAGFMAGRKIRDIDSLRVAGFELLERLEAESLLITRGENGMALFEATGELTMIPTVARTVYDVTGAGDTVIAAVAICLAAGGTMKQAAVISNIAAGEVIREIGTACTSADAIKTQLSALGSPNITRMMSSSTVQPKHVT